jgi:hypothetical protein
MPAKVVVVVLFALGIGVLEMVGVGLVLASITLE